MNKHSIAIVIPYFGKWPEWIDFFMLSCKYNTSIDWYFFTDCGLPKCNPTNCHFYHMTFEEYKQLLRDRLKIDTKDLTPYKLCDYKPTYGFIHEELLNHYDFFGFGDIDVIYGDLYKFLFPTLLKYNVFSTHKDRISGHFALFRNTQQYREAFKQVDNWQGILEDKNHHGFDEGKFSKLFRRRKKMSTLLFMIMWLINPLHRKTYFKEQYSTILAPIPWIDGVSLKHPTKWIWEKGHLTNFDDSNREFMYLHFMNFKSDTWLKEELKPAKWSLLKSIIRDPFKNNIQKFIIDEEGISVIKY